MQYIFFAFFVIIIAIALWQAFSRKGRNLGIRTEFGGKVVEDLGIIGEYSIFAGHQKLRLLKCEDKGEQFFILEADTTMPASKQYFWTRIDAETLQKLNSLVK